MGMGGEGGRRRGARTERVIPPESEAVMSYLFGREPGRVQ